MVQWLEGAVVQWLEGCRGTVVRGAACRSGYRGAVVQ